MSKKDIVLNKKSNNFVFIGIIVILVIVIGFLLIPTTKKEVVNNKQIDQQLLKQLSKSSSNNSKIAHTTVKDVDGILSFPTDSFSDSVQYFEYQGVNFFILKSNDGTIRAAFDACDVCYRSKRGYSQVGDFMQCNNCGQTFPEDKINVVLGGCNPSPLNREIVNQNLVILADDVIKGKRFF